MRTVLLFCIFLSSCLAVSGQSPELFSYQAVIRGSDNNLVANRLIGMQLSIIKGNANGIQVYMERHEKVTNENGLVSLEIGGGIPVQGDFGSIDWADGPFYLKTECDVNGGIDYTITGTSQFLSVPYAIFAKSAGNVIPGPPGVNGLSVVISTSQEPAGQNCQNGGVILEFGLDSNANGQLDAFEIDKSLSQYLCNTGVDGFKHFLGEEFGGGIIFHLWKDAAGEEHGLIVSKKNQSSSRAWSNVSNTLIGVPAQSTWNGLTNSEATVNQPGHSSSASKLCLDLLEENQNDWYLPSIDELSLLWHNRFHVNKALSQTANSVILSMVGNYWSSTEYSANTSWCFSFQTGAASIDLTKNQLGIVRAIRSF
ncbi:MAG TPA: DUF1566 domain-containing protein [Luteibaculaceae bacterium]|nr:DUF1566 domain-containing protein [Luteibaculaceae bacterium]